MEYVQPLGCKHCTNTHISLLDSLNVQDSKNASQRKLPDKVLENILHLKSYDSSILTLSYLN